MANAIIESITVTEQKLPSSDVTLPQLENEIKHYLNQISQNVIEIGKRLIQAKSFVQHGQWQLWLQNNFQLSQNTAGRFMQVAERFSNSATSQSLNQSQMIALLSLPDAEETKKFIEQKATEGTPVENMSVKTLRNEIKQWKSSREELDTNQHAEDQPIETIDISDRIASQNQDNAAQSDSKDSDNIPIDNSESQQSADEISYDYNEQSAPILEAPTELPGIYLMEELSNTSSSLINQENYKETLQCFAKMNPDQLDIVIQNLSTIVNDLQTLFKKD